MTFDRITFDPQIMAGRACIRGLRIPVFAVLIIWLVIQAGTCAAWEPRKKAKSPDEMVTALRKHGLKVQQVPASDATVEALAGHYTQGPGLSGRELHLFSDATYIDTEWADIMPMTIFSRGTWGLKDGFIVLTPDGSLPHNPPTRDLVYSPLMLSDSTDVFLMSYRWNYSYFLEEVKRRDSLSASERADLMFRICTIRRKEKPSKEAQEQKRKELMTKAWRPDFFEDNRTKEGKNPHR